ncbi:MAG TPA: DUF4173 domain-containing protein [Desulfobacteria bacterium]|nr:DUF4173 domain-containing protein [Desulfobacteria bacterium]
MIHAREQYQLGWRVTTCFLLAGLADFLFYMEGMGGAAGIYTFIILLALLFFNPGLAHNKPGKVIVTINWVLVFALIENPSGLTITLSFLGITSIALLSHPGWTHNALMWLRSVFDFWTQNIFRALSDIKLIKKLFQTEDNPNQAGIRLKNWILPLALTLVFVALFTGANPILLRWLNLINWHWIFDFLTFERVFLWSAVIILCWPLLQPRFRLNQKPLRETDFKKIRDLFHFLFSKESILYSLVIFNLLFSVQTAMDLIYLWGGTALPDGMSYAEYAHRGAYPLIATALLAGAFVLVALRPGSVTEGMQPIRYLVYCWIGQNVFLVVSSIWRTTLYIEEYSLTYLRLAALIWMGLVALGLVSLILRIVWTRSNIWLINLNGLTLLTVLMLCAFINLGSVIAQFNVEHCREVNGKGPTLDLKYLEEIGTAALPALNWFHQHGNQYNYKMAKILKLERNLRNTLNHELKKWRTWTFRSYRLSRKASADSTSRVFAGSLEWMIVPDKNELR